MENQTIIEQLGFERAINISSAHNLSDSQIEIIQQVEKIGIDKIYFSQDGNNSHPAVFIKKVMSFDAPTLIQLSEIHKKTWNYKKVLFLYVYNDTEIRVYNCVETPVFVTGETNYEKELKEKELASCNLSDEEQLKILNLVFSSVAVDSGLVWSIKEAEAIRNKINIQRRVDQYLVESLAWVVDQLQDELEIELIHRLILRSLFLLYLEDRGATDKRLYTRIIENAKNYFDILDDVTATYCLFEKLEHHFNGNVFTVEKDEIDKVKKEHLKIIRKCFKSGYKDTPLFPDWRLFDFSIIQIELLSRIYENFLAKVDEKAKKGSGSYYTPPSLVELILNEKLPVSSNEKQYDLKILDPACGSGIFLVESFKRLVRRFENFHHGKKLSDFDTLKKLLTDHIFGIECDGNAIKVAAFGLYLALVDCLDPKTLWQVKKLPFLINDPDDQTLKEQGKNLFKRDTIAENNEIESIDFDLVVGNPPFGTEKNRKLSDAIRKYCEKQGFAKEMVLPFMHKAVQFAPKGEIALIFNTKILTNTNKSYQKFRDWLMRTCYVEKVYNFSILRKAPKDFGGQLFGDAVGPISIVFFQKEQPEKPNSRIVYYAPKTYVKSNVLEGIVVDSTDVKYLPRDECQKTDTKIWKIAMWGSMADFELIKKIDLQASSTLDKYFRKSDGNWIRGDGLNKDSKHPDFVPGKIIETSAIERYYTSKNAVKSNEAYYRKIDENLFHPPFIAFKKGQNNLKITASLISYNAYCKSGVFIINNDSESSLNIKKSLVSFINSDIAAYYLFLTTASWGIEREQILLTEYLNLPFCFENANIEALTTFFDLLITELQKDYPNEGEIKNKTERLNEELLGIIGMSNYDRIHIQDILMYSLDLYEKQQKSKALLPVLDIIPYADMLCSELNDFLEDQDLFANAIIYKREIYNPLCLVKISFEKKKKTPETSKDKIDDELKKIESQLWDKKAVNIYFRKKLNFYNGDDIYLVRPNQRRFWSKSMAMEDALELIVEILNAEK